MTGFDRLGRELAHEQDQLRAAGRERAQAREQWLAAALPSRRGRVELRWAAAVIGVAAAAAAAVLLTGTQGAAPLTAVALRSGQPLVAGAFIAAEAEAEAALPVRFSDGSRLELAPGARARLVELEANGAHLLLESGRMQVAVVPRTHTRFRISAGPFLVHVKGTRFAVRWDAEQDHFELDLQHGAVEVSGCVLGQGYRMRAGQHVTASCKRRQFDVTEGASARAAVPAAAVAAQPARAAASDAAPVSAIAAAAPDAADPEPRRARARRSANASASTPASTRAVTRTERQPVAPRIDFEAECANAGAEQLTELAESARRAGDFDHEAHALRLLRRRFAGTVRGSLAAFALGRLEFDVYGEHRKAASWFAAYVREQPNGPLVREARGRLLEAKTLLGETEAARQLAASYLRDYADGPHAALARGVLSSR